ncbi:hypothetical protein [Flavobacterium poyangense]|uniref:hypothetical protein n=1 Tax=Flavobacterium poyangense TaxID=2204302 RepID=UPI00141D9299|nr:hypothetical protein [Flavobacterium sp. JXAS1]
MKNYQNKSIFLILFGLFLQINTVHSQSGNATSLYSWFDKTIGKSNLDLYNGPRYVNLYRTIDKSHSFYFSNDYSKGDVHYQNQDYYDLDLKYDVNNDILILKANGGYDYLGISLIKEKTAFFTLYNKKFININFNNPNCPVYMSGYYQELIFSKNNILYIKHHKTKTRVIDTKRISDGTNQASSDEFRDKNEYILKYKDVYYKISSKSDIIKIFPDHKSEIRKYYNSNTQLEESDKNLFLENLLKRINNLMPNEAN